MNPFSDLIITIIKETLIYVTVGRIEEDSKLYLVWSFYTQESP